jgi:hypothetical protein
MRTIIAGSRDVHDLRLVEIAVVLSGLVPTLVLSGRCQGVDRLGERWANARHIPVQYHPAEWRQYGSVDSQAGLLRNSTMVYEAEALIAVRSGPEDRGTLDTIRKAMTSGLLVHDFEVSELVSALNRLK